MRAILFAACVAAIALWDTAGYAQQAADAVAPEAASGVETRQAVHAERQMVVTANPLATQAGIAVLRHGGTAADALVTVQTVLGLVEPQSSGLGGGGFLVWYEAATGKLTTFDAREAAPAAATPDLFLDADGKPLPFFDAVVGGRSVGPPGSMRLMETIHARFGDRPWADLLQPAIDLAQNGFDVSPRLESLITEDIGRLDGQAAARDYFYDADGKPLKAGTLLKNPDYAETLEIIAADGADAFYSGPIAADIVDTVQNHATNPGLLSLADLANYGVKERDAVCAPYRGYDVCGMGPPSSGALTIGQILGIVSHFDLAALGPKNPQSWRIIGDATRLAFADRGRYMADSDFVTMPKGLLNQAYLASRAKLLQTDDALAADAVSAGEPPWDKAELRLDGITPELPSTSHFVIVDSAGNVASMTSSVENAFGSRLMVRGFLLNNQLTDFSFRPDGNGEAVANRVEAGKRPRSSMSPTIVMKDGKPVFAIGSPGGSNIISYVANALVRLIDWRMDIQAAVSAPHFVNRFGEYDLEAETDAESMADDLKTLGYEIAIKDLNSGLHGVAISAGAIAGGADPRREGLAAGD